MSRILCTIEGEDVTEFEDGRVSFRAKAAIDGDGSGSSHGDPDFQNDTSLHHNGKPLNSDVDKYIVVPPQIIRGVKGVVLGSQAFVKNLKTGLSHSATVGDEGPPNKIGELSIALADALGIPDSPTRGGDDVHEIEYNVWPGKPAVVNGKQYSLQPSA